MEHQFDYINTLAEMLKQAYYSNYSHTILDVLNRINSLKSFKLFVDEQKRPNFRAQSLFYAEEFTPDGKQFYDQGLTFLDLNLPPEDKGKYALASFGIALQLSPDEYFSPSCYFEIGKILADPVYADFSLQFEELLRSLNQPISTAEEFLQKATDTFLFFDDVGGFKESLELLEKIKI